MIEVISPRLRRAYMVVRPMLNRSAAASTLSRSHPLVVVWSVKCGGVSIRVSPFRLLRVVVLVSVELVGGSGREVAFGVPRSENRGFSGVSSGCGFASPRRVAAGHSGDLESGRHRGELPGLPGASPSPPRHLLLLSVTSLAFLGS